MQTVLIVDDHEGFRLSAKRLLETEGYDVVGQAGDGVEALAMASRLAPDVVVLDVHLPDTDGFALAAELDELGARACVVLVSSHDASDFGPLVEQSTAVGFISKSELSGAALARLVGERSEPA